MKIAEGEHGSIRRSPANLAATRLLMELVIFADQPEVTYDKSRGGKTAIQLVQKPDFYGVGGQDLTTCMCSQEKQGRGDLRGRLFHLDCMYSGEARAPSPNIALTLSSDRVKEIWLWHRQMGHPSFGVMKKKSMPSLFVGIK